MSIGEVRIILALVSEIEKADEDTAFLRKVQAVRQTAKVQAFERLRVVLRGATDTERADAILSRLEATCAPAYVPPKASSVTVMRRTAFNF